MLRAKRFHRVFVELAVLAEFLDGVAHALAILIVAHGRARVADDRERRRQAPVVRQPIESRQKFSLGQIARGAENHDGAFGNAALEAQWIRKRIPNLRHFCMVTSGLPASMESKKVLAVLDDLFFTVKINEAAKRAGLAITFVKSEHDVLEQAKTQPALIIIDMNFQGVDPLSLIRKLKADEQHQAHQPDRVSFARPGRVEAAGSGSRLRYGDGPLGVFAEPAPDPQAPLELPEPGGADF